jgi:hypothetical protein
MKRNRVRKPEERRRPEALTGLFLLRSDSAGETGPVMARIDGQLYVMVFTNAARATGARDTLGVGDARPFYICDANRAQLLRELAAVGARGFIVDYDAHNATYSAAGEIPQLAV